MTKFDSPTPTTLPVGPFASTIFRDLPQIAGASACTLPKRVGYQALSQATDGAASMVFLGLAGMTGLTVAYSFKILWNLVSSGGLEQAVRAISH